MSEQEFLNRYDNGEKFSECELKEIRWSFEEVENIVGDEHRWQKEVQTILKIGNRLFALNWMAALTECQENDFYNQPYEVELHEYEKTITVKEWVRKGE